jgi:hypothetical protein
MRAHALRHRMAPLAQTLSLSTPAVMPPLPEAAR